MSKESTSLDFPLFDAGRLERLRGRVERVVAHLEAGGFDGPARAALLEEVEDRSEEVTSDALEILVAMIDAARPGAASSDLARAARPGAASSDLSRGARPARVRPVGEWLVFRWAWSLGTGEAEVASRGFFDVWDRPPLESWVEVRKRPLPHGAAGEEIVVLAFVPASDRARARAGRRASPNQSLRTLPEASPALAAQLAPLIETPDEPIAP